MARKICKGTIVKVREDAPEDVREAFGGKEFRVVNVEMGSLIFRDRRGEVHSIRREHAERADS